MQEVTGSADLAFSPLRQAKDQTNPNAKLQRSIDGAERLFTERASTCMPRTGCLRVRRVLEGLAADTGHHTTTILAMILPVIHIAVPTGKFTGDGKSPSYKEALAIQSILALPSGCRKSGAYDVFEGCTDLLQRLLDAVTDEFRQDLPDEERKAERKAKVLLSANTTGEGLVSGVAGASRGNIGAVHGTEEGMTALKTKGIGSHLTLDTNATDVLNQWLSGFDGPLASANRANITGENDRTVNHALSGLSVCFMVQTLSFGKLFSSPAYLEQTARGVSARLLVFTPPRSQQIRVNGKFEDVPVDVMDAARQKIDNLEEELVNATCERDEVAVRLEMLEVTRKLIAPILGEAKLEEGAAGDDEPYDALVELKEALMLLCLLTWDFFGNEEDPIVFECRFETEEAFEVQLALAQIRATLASRDGRDAAGSEHAKHTGITGRVASGVALLEKALLARSQLPAGFAPKLRNLARRLSFSGVTDDLRKLADAAKGGCATLRSDTVLLPKEL